MTAPRKRLTENRREQKELLQAHLRSIGAWLHRCYHLAPRKGGGWRCRNLFVGLAKDLPITFEWPSTEDRDGVKTYIDALLLSRMAEVTQIENAGLAINVVHDTTTIPEDPIVPVKIARLADYFQLRDRFDVPLWGKVRFMTNGRAFVPIEFIAAMAQILDKNGDRMDCSGDWHLASTDDLERVGLRPEDITSSMNLRAGSATAAAEEASATPPREEQISMTHLKRHFEILSQSFPEGQPTFFTRRLFLYSGKQLWVGTSFQEKGPWKVWERATSELLALGLTPD